MKVISKIVVVFLVYLVGGASLFPAAELPLAPALEAPAASGSAYKVRVLAMSQEEFIAHVTEILNISSLACARLLSDEDIGARYDAFMAEGRARGALILYPDGRMRPFTEADMPARTEIAGPSVPMGQIERSIRRVEREGAAAVAVMPAVQNAPAHQVAFEAPDDHEFPVFIAPEDHEFPVFIRTLVTSMVQSINREGRMSVRIQRDLINLFSRYIVSLIRLEQQLTDAQRDFLSRIVNIFGAHLFPDGGRLLPVGVHPGEDGWHAALTARMTEVANRFVLALRGTLWLTLGVIGETAVSAWLPPVKQFSLIFTSLMIHLVLLHLYHNASGLVTPRRCLTIAGGVVVSASAITFISEVLGTGLIPTGVLLGSLCLISRALSLRASRLTA